MNWWKEKIVAPIAAQITQGVTPEKIALTIALGAVVGVFPILGATTALCGLAGVAWRLNQPIIQLVNYLLTPLHLALLIPFYRAGEQLLQLDPIPLSITLLFERFNAGFWKFLHDFGMIAVGGILVWLLIAPFAIGAIYCLTRHPLQLFALKLQRP